MDINAKLKADIACSARGASMGRADWRGDPEFPIKFHLQYIRFVDGGYDLGGAYWGLPANLYCAWGEDEGEQVRMFVRASSRDQAKHLIREEYVNAKFYRESLHYQ